jgi:hypothetical protein
LTVSVRELASIASTVAVIVFASRVKVFVCALIVAPLATTTAAARALNSVDFMIPPARG